MKSFKEIVSDFRKTRELDKESLKEFEKHRNKKYIIYIATLISFIFMGIFLFDSEILVIVSGAIILFLITVYLDYFRPEKNLRRIEEIYKNGVKAVGNVYYFHLGEIRSSIGFRGFIYYRFFDSSRSEIRGSEPMMYRAFKYNIGDDLHIYYMKDNSKVNTIFFN